MVNIYAIGSAEWIYGAFFSEQEAIYYSRYCNGSAVYRVCLDSKRPAMKTYRPDSYVKPPLFFLLFPRNPSNAFLHIVRADNEGVRPYYTLSAHTAEHYANQLWQAILECRGVLRSVEVIKLQMNTINIIYGGIALSPGAEQNSLAESTTIRRKLAKPHDYSMEYA